MRWLALAVVLAPAIARADAESCVAASDEGQKLRDEGHLRAARAKLVTCAAEQCPSPVRANCVQWLDDVDKRTPSVVIAATANGKDATDVKVSIDGALVASKLDGSALLLDPGEHKVRYEHAGDPPRDETIVLREGEKDRALHVGFDAPKPLTPPKAPPTFAYAMTGLGLASAAIWGGFGLGTLFIMSDFDRCHCDASAHQTNATITAVVADVALGVAVVATGLAIWAYVKHARTPAPQAAGFDAARGVLVF